MTHHIDYLSTLGIRYYGDKDGLSLFKGAANKHKAAVDLSELEGDDAVTAVQRAINRGQTEWPTETPPEPIEAESLVPMRTGPYGGYHVLIDGEWLRVRKE